MGPLRLNGTSDLFRCIILKSESISICYLATAELALAVASLAPA